MNDSEILRSCQVHWERKCKNRFSRVSSLTLDRFMSHQDQNWQNNASNAVCALSIGSWYVVENSKTKWSKVKALNFELLVLELHHHSLACRQGHCERKCKNR